jgi:hypothetical protein
MQTDTSTAPRSKLDRMRPKDYVQPMPPSPRLRFADGTVVGIEIVPLRQPRRTRQGVNDLNGPKMNGTGYNGSRSTTCQHWRDPQSVATHVVETMVVGIDGLPMCATATHCSACGHLMSTEIEA